MSQVSLLKKLMAFGARQSLVLLIEIFLRLGDVAVHGQQRSKRNGNLPAVVTSRA